MAEPQLKRGLELLLYRETAVAGVFDFVCGITNKSGTFTRNLAENVVPDCDDPTATPWTKRTATSRTAQFSGSGLMAMEKRADIQADFDSDANRNWRLIIQSVGYWQGAFQLANFQPGAQEGDAFITLSIELQSDGAVPWTDDLTAGL